MASHTGNGLQPREKVARVYRDGDEGFDLVISIIGTPRRGLFDVDSAEVRKTRIGSTQSNSEVSAFEVYVAIEVLKTHSAHVSSDPEIARLQDLLNEGHSFFVDRAQLEALLEKQKREIGPVVVPARIKQGDFEGSGKDDSKVTKQDPPVEEKQAINRPVATSRHPEIDEVFAHIDEALRSNEGFRSGRELA